MYYLLSGTYPPSIYRFNLRETAWLTGFWGSCKLVRLTKFDVLWATALAVYATANMEPEPFLAVISR